MMSSVEAKLRKQMFESHEYLDDKWR